MRKVSSIIFFLALALSLIAFAGVALGQNDTVTGITVTPNQISPYPALLLPGDTQQLTATATMDDGSQEDVTNSCTWSTNNGTIATVSSTGLVTGQAAGQDVISASVSSVSGSSTVSVVYACPENGARHVPIDMAVDVVLNQNIDADSNLSAITMTDNGTATDPFGNPESLPSVDAHVYNNDDVLWILDPWNGDGLLPPKDQITVGIPAGCLTFQDGSHNPELNFSFTTANYDAAEYTTYSAWPNVDHYLFSFTTPQTATLTVVKKVYGSDTPPSAFMLYVKNPDGQNVTDVNGLTSPQAGSATGASYTLDVGAGGTYTVSEDAYSNYTASFSGDCDASGNVTLAPGGNKTVTVTNTYSSPTTVSLTVYKTVDGGPDDVSDFTLHVTNPATGDVVSQQASTNGNTFSGLSGNTSYTVSEDPVAGYTPDFEDIASGGDFDSVVPAISGTVNMGTTDRIVHFTNVYQTTGGQTVSLTVYKHVYGGPMVASDFTLYVKNNDGQVVEDGPGSETGTSYALGAGTYSVSESVSGSVYESVYGDVYESYTPSFSDGGFDTYDSVSGTVNLTAGGARAVTITNTYSGGSGPGPGSTTGALTVIKHVDGGTAPVSDFTLHVKQDNSEASGSPQQASVSGNTFSGLSAGTYTISESGGPTGYTASFSDGGFDTYDSVSGTVYLTAGGARAVTITNTYSGSGNSNPPSGGNPPSNSNSGNSNGNNGNGNGNTPGNNATGGANPAPTPGENPNAAPPPGPPNAAPPPGPPKLPKTGVDPGGASVPWQVPAGILSIALLSFVVVKRKRIFSSR